MGCSNYSENGLGVHSPSERVCSEIACYLRARFGVGLKGVMGVGGAITLAGSFAISFAGALWAIAYSAGSALAQITPDATLGVEGSIVTPNVNIRGFPADRIDGGVVRGANLFHSFQEFNVRNGQRIYFANPTGIENILSRVTGNNLSNILGTLGVDGGANLFLLNPNGIIFGSNAKLDIAGSFVASTANSAVFDNGFVFSAKNPEAPPLLTVSVPLGVQYGVNQPKATITNVGNLVVGQTLTLDAGNLDLQGQLQAGKDLTLQAQDSVKVRDSVTNPFIAAALGQLLVQGHQKVDIFALNHTNSGLYSGGDMVLRSANPVIGDAHYWSGGNFRIEKLDGSLGNLHSPNDPVIRSLGDVTFTSYEGSSLHILAAGRVNIDSVVITTPETGTGIVGTDYLAESVTLSDGSVKAINGSAFPTLDVRAGVNPTFVGNPGLTGNAITDIFNNIPIFGRPTITNTPSPRADITINAISLNQGNGLVFLSNQYQPNTLPGNIQVKRIRTGADGPFRFPGNGGDIVMDSRGDIIIPEPNLFDPITIRTNSINGNAGNITLIANGSFIMRGGGQLGAPSFGQGNAGDINIFVRDSVLLTNSSKLFTDSTAQGNAGNINIRAGSLSIDNSALQANTEGRGNAGSITIDVNRLGLARGGRVLTTSSGAGKAGDIAIAATDSVNVSQAFIITGSTGAGDSGNLSIRTRQLNVGNGGQLSTVSAAQGKAGNLSIEAADSVNVSDLGFVFTGTGESSTGNSGNLSIGTGKLNVSGGGQITTASRGTGNAGNLAIAASDLVNVSTQGLVTTSSIGAGNSGNLSISTRQLQVSDRGSAIGSNSLGKGKAGNLAIAATDSVTVSNEGLLTTGTNPGSAGNGGTLSISTRQLDVKDGGQISTASTGTGNSGNLAIAASDSMNVVNRGVVTTSSDKGAGVAGRLNLETGRLSIQDNSLVVSSTIGAGDAGDLNVRATDSIAVVNSSKLSADTLGSGNGGNLNIETNRLSIRDSEVSTGTLRGSSGKGGRLRVNAGDAVEINGVGGLVSATLGQGKGGDIQLSANSLSLTNGGSITSLSDGRDQAGNIAVNLRGNLRSSGGNISASSLSAGGGNINITADDIRLRDSSLISSSVFDSTGGGGNITINSTVFLAIEDSDILANAQAGPGGNITINSPGFIADLFSSGAAVAVGRNPGDFTQFRGNGRNDISVSLAASSRNNGRVDISTASATGPSGISNYSYRDPTQGAATLPSNLVDAEGLIDRRCSPNSTARKSSFTITGRGGLPPSPTDPLTNENIWVDWITLKDRPANRNGAATEVNPSSSNPQQLVEAQGWVIGSDGKVILTAAASKITPASSGLVSPSCQDNQAAPQ